MQYFYLKLGKNNNQLYYWLQQTPKIKGKEEPPQNIYNKPTAVIYFSKITTEEIKNGDPEELKKKYNKRSFLSNLNNQMDEISWAKI